MNADLAIKWLDDGPAQGTVNLIPYWWFAEDGYTAFKRHVVLGKDNSWRAYALCSVKVEGAIVDLDFGGVHASQNEADDWDTGVTRLIFEDDRRIGLPSVQWRYPHEVEFKTYGVEVRRRSTRAKNNARFDPTDDNDGRKRIEQMVAVRQGQSTFRNELLVAYGGQCAITGCRVAEVLQAAHIKPYLGKHTNHVTNGLLLRADIHTLFDLGIIKIDKEYRITAHASIISAFSLPDRITNLPKDVAHYPSPDAFDAKWPQ